MVIAQPLFDDRFRFGTETELPSTAPGVTDRQDPNRMALAAGTNGTTGAMANDAAEQGTADDLGGEGEGSGKLGPLPEGCFLIIYIDETTQCRIWSSRFEHFLQIMFFLKQSCPTGREVRRHRFVLGGASPEQTKSS